MFSCVLMPRPTATIRSACDRSTACFASWNGASGCLANGRGVDRDGARAVTGAALAPRCAASARNAPIWNVTRCGAAPSGATSAVSLPWNIGRANAAAPSTRLTAMTSVIERAIERRRQRRREVARLIGVRKAARTAATSAR